MTMNKTKSNRGFTLVEIAIVLVIIGLLLGGILKGQELINNAKVRAIADRQNSLKVAWFSFIDRFSALPGDYVQAADYITGVGNGAGDGIIAEKDAPLVTAHLAAAGYLRCGHCTVEAGQETSTAPTANNSLVNNYGGVMAIFHDSTNYQVIGGPSDVQRLMIHSGPRIPSNILAEVDRKIDDGVPDSGDMLFNNWDATGASSPPVSDCTNTGTNNDPGTLTTSNTDRGKWRVASSSPPVFNNCGASVNI